MDEVESKLFKQYMKNQRSLSKMLLYRTEGNFRRDFYRIKYFALGWTFPSKTCSQPISYNAHCTVYYKLLWAQILEFSKEKWPAVK